jgi:uncharacterized protein (DUF1330 family)
MENGMDRAPPPVAYVISAVEGFTGEDQVKKYADAAGPAIQQFGGRFIIANAEPRLIEGESQTRHLSVVEFPSMKQANSWYDSPEYAEARNLTPAAFSGRLLMFVEGDETPG